MGAAELSLPSISTEHRRFGGSVVEIPNLPHLKVKAFGHDTFQNTVTAAFPKSTTIIHVKSIQARAYRHLTLHWDPRSHCGVL